jgi:PAS domain S-box-containing protein
MIVATVVDLTDRIHAAEELSQSEQRLRDILDNTPAVVYVKDTQSRYLLINRQFEQLFGVTRESVKGLTDYDIFPQELADVFRANDLHVAKTGQVVQAEEAAPHKDGIRTYLSVKFPLRDHDGKIYAIAGISTDITERVRSAQEAMFVRRRLELILSSIADGILGLDHEGTATFVNPAAESMLRRTAAEIVGLHHKVTLQQARSDGTLIEDDENELHQALAEGTDHHCDDRMFYRPDGTAFPVEIRSTPVEEEGKVAGSVITFQDISERKQRRQAQHEMEAARRVQQKLYPKEPPGLPGFDIDGHTFPASQACGDYFDFVDLPNGNLALIIGDVAGHGLGPALQMVHTRAYLRAMLMCGKPPVEALQTLNELQIQDTPQESFLTLFMAILDPRQKGFVYVGAGHEARLMRGNGTVEPLDSTGMVVGVLPNTSFQPSRPFQMRSGDCLLIMTDGVLEAVSPTRELFGWDRTLDVVRANLQRPASTIIDRLHAATKAFSAGKEHADDVTLIVAKAL